MKKHCHQIQESTSGITLWAANWISSHTTTQPECWYRPCNTARTVVPGSLGDIRKDYRKHSGHKIESNPPDGSGFLTQPIRLFMGGKCLKTHGSTSKCQKRFSAKRIAWLTTEPSAKHCFMILPGKRESQRP